MAKLNQKNNLSNRLTELSNPYSTGGGGQHFEAHVQASFVTLMLTGGYTPCLPCWPIKEIKLQGKIDGFETDDLIVFVEHPTTKERRKILGQIKHTIRITRDDKMFAKVILAAWKDFNNPSRFTKNKDVIALITGSLSATDTEDVRWLLQQAQHTRTEEEFFRNIEQTHFSSDQKRKKLDAFRVQLRKANNNTDISAIELYSFLNNFHIIGYDLGTEEGVVLSLLHSHISQFNTSIPKMAWSRIVDVVQTWNQNAGTICFEKLPEDLREAFQHPTYEIIPAKFSQSTIVTSKPEKPDFNNHSLAADLVIANFIGAWDENSTADKEIITKLANEDYDIWIGKIKEIHQMSGTPLSLKNGKWLVEDRMMLWRSLSKRVYDDILDRFKQCIVLVLSEHDPKFDLPNEQRLSANLYGIVLKHSPELRKGMAETLALIGNKPEELTNCSQGKPEAISVLSIREIFNNANWIGWASLNDLLPILAEAAPGEFLKVTEKTLYLTPSPFDDLFLQEGDGITGYNYTTGLLWALECLAWDQNFIIQACTVLAELAIHDPGGRWANRPSNSLTSIFLPWFPQTMSTIEKRILVIQTLRKEFPEVAWRLILSLLPNQNQVAMGTYKPKWRLIIPDSWNKEIKQDEYWEQIEFYAEMLVSMAKDDLHKLTDLIDHLNELPQSPLEKAINTLSSINISDITEDDRLTLWNKIVEFIQKIKHFHNAKWMENSELINRLEAISEHLAPGNPVKLYRRLFNGNDYDLFEENSNWQEQMQSLEANRQGAINKIVNSGGLDSLLAFIESVEAPSQVGYSYGFITEGETDLIILPNYLLNENKKLEEFTSGYVGSKFKRYSWAWFDRLDKSKWSSSQIAQILCYLPFTEGTWNRAVEYRESESEYWMKTSATPYHSKDDLGFAIDKLIEYKRSRAALRCIFRMLFEQQPLDNSKSEKALLTAISSTEPFYSTDTYQIIEIIKKLQNDPTADQDSLFQIEWAYLTLLDYDPNVTPKVLENRLASDPTFFCELIRLIYRSKNEEKPRKEAEGQDNSNAINAWRLLNKWKTPPGVQPDGTFSLDKFNLWLDFVVKKCSDSGHVDMAMIHVGQVFIHFPPDSDGLWIPRVIANVLNDKNAGKMREGFSLATINSRGAHMVDPTAKPEYDLAKENRLKAEIIEREGYQRLAATMRNIADTYDHEAKRILDDNSGL